ncbi:hypothetical protein [Acanthopleuribacter pedis]|uniref:Uncharacterized protein n=1 Tax=Acanthopleuribacter pedis TaxID=442870 RepID=A0A8J7QFP3_9BACT|nr:hypothetical protein [Acanthopleuribacter pedis]MBO1323239.1 hypothetical protein [Acanthopleuribacter pedis]
MDDLLYDVYKAYRAGLLGWAKAEAPQKEPRFPELLQQALEARIPEDLRQVVRAMWDTNKAGLEAARHGELEEAAELFQQSRDTIEAPETKREIALLGLSSLEAAQAYLDYRHRDFQGAQNRVFAAMDADLELERQYGYRVLQLHRIQAAHNFMRVHLRSKRPAEAMRLGGAIVGYLEGRRRDLPVHHTWNRNNLTFTNTLLSNMIAQVAKEAALALFDLENHEGWVPFYEGLQQNPELIDDAQVVHPKVFDWVKVRQARAQGDQTGYLKALIQFLTHTPQGISAIWYATLIDFMNDCATQPGEMAAQITKVLNADAKKWPNLHPYLKKRLDHPVEAHEFAGAQTPGVGAY